MQYDLKRTHATSLTDDELILLDVMFSIGPAHTAQTADNPCFWTIGIADPHNLDDHQLRDTDGPVCEAGILVSELFTWGTRRVCITG